MYRILTQDGFDQAINFYDSARQQSNSSYDFSESDMNLFGYYLLSDANKVDDAIKIFELNTQAYP